MIAVAAVALALVGTPVALPGWNTTYVHAEAVDAAGRGVVVFPHGEHTWAASIAPDGSLAAVGRIEAQRAVDGPRDPGVAIDDAGDVVASYVAETDEHPRGADGYGFVVQPWSSRFAWGQPPAPGRRVAGGPIDVEATRIAMRPGGTALLAFAQSTASGFASRAALLAPGGGMTVRRFAGLRGARPVSSAVTAAGTFVTGWSDGRRVSVTHVDAAGRFGAVTRVPVDGREVVAARVLVDSSGDEVAVWETARKGTDHEVFVAARRAGARRFGAVRRLPRGPHFVDAAVGPDGSAAILVALRRRAVTLVRRTPGGRLLAPVVLPGAVGASVVGGDPAQTVGGDSARVVVAAGGSALAAYTANTTPGGAARTVRVAADGSVRVVSDAAGCSVLGLAGTPSGAALLTLACPGPEGRDVGAAQAIPAGS